MDRRWVIGMRWERLLFAHWPLPAETLVGRIPPGLVLDTFDGAAWIGIVPFRMARVGLPGTPLPGRLGRFGELNVRTYVRPERPGDGPAGVWFLSLDAENPYVVAGGRAVFHVPYFRARISIADSGDAVDYRLKRTHRGAPPARFRASYRLTGQPGLATEGSLEDWLTARFAVYAASAAGQLCRGDIRHAPWRLAPATWHLRGETLLAANGLERPGTPPLLHGAAPVDVVAAWPKRISIGSALPLPPANRAVGGD